jgi:hypothetical protein
VIVVIDEPRRHRLAAEINDFRIGTRKFRNILGGTDSRNNIARDGDSLGGSKIFINRQYYAVQEDKVGRGLSYCLRLGLRRSLGLGCSVRLRRLLG